MNYVISATGEILYILSLHICIICRQLQNNIKMVSPIGTYGCLRFYIECAVNLLLHFDIIKILKL